MRSILRLPDCQLLVSQLSGGAKRRVSIAVALINRPSIVVLDEPTVGIDPLVRQQIWEFLKNECKRGMTAIIVTHYVEEAVAADRVGLMRNGRILAEDCPQNLMQMFATNSLEEVFLRLCLAENQLKDTEGMALYKTRNKYTNHFEYDFNNNPKDVNSFSRLKISLWLILIVIHKNVEKFSKLSISLIIILLPATQAFLFCLIYSKPLIQVLIIRFLRYYLKTHL